RSKRDWSSDVCSSDLQVEERVLLRGIEARRLEQEPVHRVAQGADEAERLERRQVEPGEGRGVHAGEGPEPLPVQARGEDLGGLRSEERRVGEEGRWRW